MLVVLGELKIPVQFSGIRIECQQAVAIKVVPRSALAPIGGGRIARWPEELIGCGIIDARHPRGRAASLPGVAFPRIVPRLASPRHGVEPPLPLARVRVVGVNKAADAVFTPGHPQDDQILHHQRRHRKAVAFGVVGGGNIPDNVSGFRIEGDHVGVERGQENLVTHDGQPAIHATAAGSNVIRQLTLIHPHRTPGARIESKGPIVLAGRIQDAVDHQRSRFKFPRAAGLIDPLRNQ